MNISFLNQAFLWALPLALGPLIIHLFFRRRPKKIEFSDLRFIRLAAEKIQTRVRLRRYLLLLVRTLIILFLILSFAKPYFQSALGVGGSGKNDKLSAVILLDISYSSGYYDGPKQRIAFFREAAKKIINMLPPQSRAGIIAYSSKVEAMTPALTGDRIYLASIIDEIKLSNGATDLACALKPAADLLDSVSSSNRALIILSDMAEHGFRARPKLDGEKARVIYFEPAGGDNACLQNVSVDYVPEGGVFQLNAEAKVYGKINSEQLGVTYYAQDRKIGSDFMSKSENGEYKSSFNARDIKENMLTGRAELAPDKLEADNVFYFVKKKPADYKIWIIDGDPKFGGVSSASFYLKNVFPRAEVISESAAGTANFTVPGVVILVNVSGDNAKISQFVKSGGGALVFPGNHTSENFAPDYLPAEIGSKFSGVESLTWSAAGHPLQEIVETGSFDWKKIRVEQGFVLMPKENTTVLAALDSGRAYFVEGSCGVSRIVLCASTADREWNNMPSQPLYAPFMAGLVKYISGVDSKEEKTSFVVGETYRAKAPAGSEIITPKGSRIKAISDGNEIYFSALDEPGLYRVINGGKDISSFAVNLDAKSGEGNLTPISSRALKEYFSGRALLSMPRAGWEKYFAALISGKDITRVMFACLFLLILLEILLANPKASK